MEAKPFRLGRFDVEARLGAGAMGVVYRARDLELQRDVAIKVLDAATCGSPDSIERFEREGRMLAALRHPHIAAIYGLERDGETRGLVLELLDGETLAARLARGALPVGDALRYAEQLADALEAAHAKGIVHRDLKPANIQITADDTLKVLDFGIAKTVTPATTETTFATATGLILGTAPYMSPEVLRGAPPDRRADVWSFGCVLYEMLTGRRAFDGATAADVLAATMTRRPDMTRLPAGAGVSVVALLGRCLEADVRLRQRDMGDVRSELLRIAAHPTEVIGVDDRPRPQRERRWRSVAAVVVMAAVAAAAGWATRHGGDATAQERYAFQFDAPAGATWNNRPPDPLPQVSPDGRQIAFTATVGDTSGIWVRDLAALESRLIPGTDDAPNNFSKPGQGFSWSSDSRRLAYCVGGKVKLVSLDGRGEEQIDAGCRSDVAWGPRGDFLVDRADGLFIVPSSGGTGTRATTMDAATGVIHAFARWLPDGRRFVFTMVSANPEVAGIYAAGEGTGPPRRLVADESKADVAVDRANTPYLVFVRRATLVAQPLDGRTLAPNGAPIELAQRMAIGASRKPSFSTAGGTLVYRSGGGFGNAAWTLVDRRGRHLGLAFGGDTFVGAATLTPDRKSLVYSRFNRDTNTLGLWRGDLERGVTQPLFEPPYLVDFPAYAPDGTRLAVGAAPPRRFDVMTMPVGSADPVPLVAAAGGSAPRWTRDGRALVFQGPTGVSVVAVEHPGAVASVIVPRGIHPALSPDGHWLAFASDVTGRSEVYVQPFPGPGERQRVSLSGGYQPQWRDDGGELFYIAPDNSLMAVGVAKASVLALSPPTKLFDVPFAPDGRIASSQHLLPLDGGRSFFVNLQTAPAPPLTVVRGWLP